MNARGRGLPQGVEGLRAARERDRERLKKRYLQEARIRVFSLPAVELGEVLAERPAAALTTMALYLVLSTLGMPLVLRFGPLVGVGLPALLVAGLYVGFRYAMRAPSRTTLVVRDDGVVVRGRFFPHSMLGDVYHYAGRRRALRTRDPSGAPAYQHRWLLLLGFAQGDAVRLGARWLDDGQEDAWGADVALEIEAARAAWAERHAGLTVVESAVARGQRSGREWLGALRQIGARAGAAYRAVPLDVDRLSRLLDDGDARPSARAAAAIVLAAAGDTTTPARLRVALETVADARLRVALEAVADARDDDAVAEALDALEADGEENAR